MFHGHVDYFQKPPLGSRPNNELGDYGTLNAHNCWFIIFLSCVRFVHKQKSIEIAFGWGPVTYDFTLHSRVRNHYMTLEVCWDGLWTLSFGLSQLHGHGSWLVCEVALSPKYDMDVYNATLFGGGVVSLVKQKTRPSCIRTYFYINKWRFGFNDN